MSYVYEDVRKLQGKPKEGEGECVTLVRNHTSAGWTGKWKQGEAVVGNRTLRQGTAIANFENGRWPGRAHGNHSAFYLGQVSDGIYVMDQYPAKNGVGQRFIRRQGKDKHGKFINPTDNADAFFVIE
jgi:hypothetical protein